MHSSALYFGRLFFDTYCDTSRQMAAMDIGAQDVNGSLKNVCPPNVKYTGVDFVEGNGVDVVLDDPYRLPYENDSLDVVVCSSCFEHSQFFWVLFLEILRVLKPDGLLYINAPSNGHIHRYPVDCWRFYPDAGHALTAWGERNGYTPILIESFIGAQRDGPDGFWSDFIAVFQKDRTHKSPPTRMIIDQIDNFQNGWRWNSGEILNDTFHSEDYSKLQQSINLAEKRDASINILNTRISALESQVNDCADKIESANDTIYQQQLKIDALNATIKCRDNEIVSRDLIKLSLDKNIGDVKAKISDLSKFIDLLKKEKIILENENSSLKVNLNYIVTSTSWRITLPLRKLKTILMKEIKIPSTPKIKPGKFDRAWYVSQNHDVAISGIEPYEHYIHHGMEEGRQPCPPSTSTQNHTWSQILRNLSLIVGSQKGKSGSPLQKAIRVLKESGVKGLRSRLALLAGYQQGHISTDTSTAVDPSSFDGTTIVLDQNHHYRIGARNTYVYIPPRRPDNMDQIVEAMAQHPTFSIIVPIYNTPSDLLKKVIESVKSQWYPYWELVLADDGSTSKQTITDLSLIDDSQIVVLTLDKNRGIAGATNFAIEHAKGEFVVFLDHDDELTEDCLYELAQCINRENPDYIYSDEDKIDTDGRFTEPHFKPDWSPDTMMSTMYVCHVSCVRHSLLLTVGGLRSDYDGCQDWDLVLRITEKTTRISHIARVLYHWRIIPASIAADIAAKPYVLEASRRVREDALERRELAGTVEPCAQLTGYFHVNYHIQGTPLVSIIIPSRDNGDVLRQCIESILNRSHYRNFELIILDNGSTDAPTLRYLELIAKQENTTVIRHDAPFNFSELNNIGASRASGEILLFLNDDTEVISPEWIERMAGYAQLPHSGAIGAKLLYPGAKKIQHAGILNLADGPGHAFLQKDASYPGYYLRNILEYNWLAVTGACLMITRDKFHAVGGFDEKLPIAYNDVELCFRLYDAGHYNIVCQSVELIHHESLSRGLDHMCSEKRERLGREKHRLYMKHPRYFQHDPFYNTNLHPNGINFEIPG